MLDDIKKLALTAECICGQCKKPMQWMWDSCHEPKQPNGPHRAYIVFHCWDCDNDREVELLLHQDGQVDRKERRFFFG